MPLKDAVLDTGSEVLADLGDLLEASGTAQTRSAARCGLLGTASSSLSSICVIAIISIETVRGEPSSKTSISPLALKMKPEAIPDARA